jgi:hypothetical protein
MDKRPYGLRSLADRRYYHFIVMTARHVSLNSYWRKVGGLGKVERPRLSVSFGTSSFAIEHRKIQLDKPYARGETARSLSERGGGRAPFWYDLFAASVELGRDRYIALGFPFASLAFDIISYLDGVGYTKNEAYQGVNLRELMSESKRRLQGPGGLRSVFVGMQFVVMDDKSLTAVRLGGDDPFHADIYERYLKQKFESGLWVPDQCVLACEREDEPGKHEKSLLLMKSVRSRLHIDRSGNFKFYAHAGCRNLTLMPEAIAQINDAACLKQVFGNPLAKTEQEEI